MDFSRSNDRNGPKSLRDLSWPQAYDLLFRHSLPASWEVQAGGYLYWRGYTVEAIRSILDHARAHGSVECFDAIPLPILDRQAVEQLLPDAPDADWNAHAGIWELNP